MRVLLDHCVPHRLSRHFAPHQCQTALDAGWESVQNGKLLAAAASAGFDVLVTLDQNIKCQQNLSKLAVAVLVIRVHSNDIDELVKLMPQVLLALEGMLPRTLVEVPPSA